MTKRLGEYNSPAHKVLSLLHAGRDKLREKYRALRQELRAAQNQVRAVEKSREAWRQKAEAALEELREQKKRLG